MNLNGYKYIGETAANLQGAEKSMQENFELPLTIIELVRIRCSQLNGCHVCSETHIGVARRNGESDERLMYLPVWREAPESLYTCQERAALDWAEAVTMLNSNGGISKHVAEHVQQHFSPRQLSELTLSISTINMWNRQTMAFGKLQKYFP
ncbi:carboxymuconolactone decarboxylase family protein [Angomonas deanei]|uniref:Carboxymuconolactone decarboxylase family, putative n=1 Tax=Angomonas deanei TaxID=59799 RepID=A0A7G2CQ73_9TRYP|nr:carboxymuconolactone decarboxylase family protein [Angomonas deanei]CAD2220693.1 Carboxymuconolactone decarboxylase family, putative [Angomonas deanei]|eukprot:EPY17898.1 carboxymuconolactone decarboxylase family protein [Angomonas deanei]